MVVLHKLNSAVNRTLYNVGNLSVRNGLGYEKTDLLFYLIFRFVRSGFCAGRERFVTARKGICASG